MSSFIHRNVGIAVLAILTSSVSAQQKSIHPDPPELTAKYAKLSNFEARAEQLLKQGKLEEACLAFEDACLVEKELPGRPVGTEFKYGRALDRAGLFERALVQYKKIFAWDPKQQKLSIRVGPNPETTMQVAICLAKANRVEEAKAVYHLGLSAFNFEGDRYREPVPFLVVFAPEPTGDEWEYSEERLEAAASMLIYQARGGGEEAFNRIKTLAPNWLFPTFWRIAQVGNPDLAQKLIAQCDALTMSKLDRAQFDQYKKDYAEHLRLNDVNDTPNWHDTRPMLEGYRLRTGMACLKTCVDVVRRYIESE